MGAGLGPRGWDWHPKTGLGPQGWDWHPKFEAGTLCQDWDPTVGLGPPNTLLVPGLGLPMPYQSSAGTPSALLGP